MFRDIPKKSEIKPKCFGIGSIVKGSPNDEETWLVIQFQDSGVMLLNLTTFETTNSLQVDDPCFLTSLEARNLVDKLNQGYAFSDYSLIAEGIKDNSVTKRFKY